jgi:hypothetical protein
MEKPLLKAQRAPADYADLILGGLVPGPVAHACDGKPPASDLSGTHEGMTKVFMVSTASERTTLSQRSRCGRRPERGETIL